ncbi:hypothetical protein T484DRAFT_1743061 [Baffinella frigidus]|nr:hypothetical protein T484DRAFT_1743061 [Cryptophyta sp. CCMP2293]
MRLPVLALACLAAVALSAVVVLSQRGSAVSLSQYPKSDIGMLKVMQSMATAPAKAAPVAAAPKAHGKGDLSMPQQVTLSGLPRPRINVYRVTHNLSTAPTSSWLLEGPPAQHGQLTCASLLARVGHGTPGGDTPIWVPRSVCCEARGQTRDFKVVTISLGRGGGEIGQLGRANSLRCIDLPRHVQPASSDPAPPRTSQYARIMQNLGYFAPWSRQNSWADRVAVNNIRKANTPSALARKQSQIAAV